MGREIAAEDNEGRLAGRHHGAAGLEDLKLAGVAGIDRRRPHLLQLDQLVVDESIDAIGRRLRERRVNGCNARRRSGRHRRCRGGRSSEGGRPRCGRLGWCRRRGGLGWRRWYDGLRRCRRHSGCHRRGARRRWRGCKRGRLGRGGDRGIGRRRTRTRRFAGRHDGSAAPPQRDIERGRSKRPDDKLKGDHDPQYRRARTAADGAARVAVREFGWFDAIGRPRRIAGALGPHALTGGLRRGGLGSRSLVEIDRSARPDRAWPDRIEVRRHLAGLIGGLRGLGGREADGR